MALFRGTSASETLNGTDENDVILAFDGNDVIYGNGGDDRILTGYGWDLTFGGDGDDYIRDSWNERGTEIMHGGDGDDILSNVNAFDRVGPEIHSLASFKMYGDEGNDRLVVSGVSGRLEGGVGNDHLTLGAWGGTMTGGEGNDKLYGYDPKYIFDIPPSDPYSFDKYAPNGSQTYDGGAGNDIMVGSHYTKDTFILRPGEGNDVIRNIHPGGRLPTDEVPFGITDYIDLTAFEFEMSAAALVVRYGVERDGRTILNLGEGSRLVVMDVTADELVESLII